MSIINANSGGIFFTAENSENVAIVKRQNPR
jgi:hypothetical protein